MLRWHWRVKAAVLLHEAGKDGTYIKLRIRWLSDCFEVYLRNTPTICAQHNTALQGVNQQMMAAIAVLQANPPCYAVHNAVAVDVSMTDIEDDDCATYSEPTVAPFQSPTVQEDHLLVGRPSRPSAE